MVQRKIDKNQSKLGIVTLDSNIPKDHISRFVVEFIEEVFPILESVKFYRLILFLDVFRSNFPFGSLKMSEFHF